MALAKRLNFPLHDGPRWATNDRHRHAEGRRYGARWPVTCIDIHGCSCALSLPSISSNSADRFMGVPSTGGRGPVVGSYTRAGASLHPPLSRSLAS
ncbi:hypothetical protein EVAR_12404_1 [Eumeta japonica]|uniref:Uncharacterized protein n=1 Tax=Eumeta variegata TaxID=151549 RepID=A0A4C1TZ60_EUMVA|nr:hypothetical protein EVAR_12404_1 [Eumeta japonica]